jgi:hypothetical protein
MTSDRINTDQAAKQSLAAQRDQLKAECRASFDAQTGAEAEIYSNSIDLVADALDQLSNPRVPVNELSHADVAAYAIAGYAYQLIAAIWDELRAGRAVAAETMLRPAYEAPDFMFALLHDPSCLEDWKTHKNGLSITRVRKASANYVDSLSPGQGKRWRTNRKATHDWVQNAPHVNPRTVGKVFARATGRWSMAPDGSYSGDIHLDGIIAARLALDLMSVLKIAFETRLTRSWLEEVHDLEEAASSVLRAELLRIEERGESDAIVAPRPRPS